MKFLPVTRPHITIRVICFPEAVLCLVRLTVVFIKQIITHMFRVKGYSDMRFFVLPNIFLYLK